MKELTHDAALALLAQQRVPVLCDTLYRRATEAGYTTSHRQVAAIVGSLYGAGKITITAGQDGRSRVTTA